MTVGDFEMNRDELTTENLSAERNSDDVSIVENKFSGGSCLGKSVSLLHPGAPPDHRAMSPSIYGEK